MLIIECPENKGIKTRRARPIEGTGQIIECPENKGIKTAIISSLTAGIMIIECPENKGIKTRYCSSVSAMSAGLSNALKTKGLRPGQVIRYR